MIGFVPADGYRVRGDGIGLSQINIAAEVVKILVNVAQDKGGPGGSRIAGALNVSDLGQVYEVRFGQPQNPRSTGVVEKVDLPGGRADSLNPYEQTADGGIEGIQA